MSEDLPVLRVCFGMPGYGTAAIGAAIGALQASTGVVTINGERFRLQVDFHYQAGSLLAQNFNALWCWALNEAHEGRPVHYFAMLHDDISPGRHWLDLAIPEMESQELDLLGVVVPIKCSAGLTSIALDDPDGDSWRPKCRLTLHEVHRLPETFTSDDVGYPLLLNTGCWVCRFNPEWAKHVHFTIQDKIRFDEKVGRYVAEVEPEDWHFSRLCHGLGLKLGATRKIQVAHAGSVQYMSSQPWGTHEFDQDYVTESVIPFNTQQAAENCPAEVLQEV